MMKLFVFIYLQLMKHFLVQVNFPRYRPIKLIIDHLRL